MPRELSRLLAPEDEGPFTLDQKQRREILRRLDHLEAEHGRLRRENQELRRKLEDRERELDRLKPNAAAPDVATPPSKQVDRPPGPAPAEPRPKGHRPGGQPGHAPQTRPRPDHVDETLDLTLDRCPDCGMRLGDSSDSYERFVTELIPTYLFVLRILVHRYWCRRCRRYVQGTTDQALPGRQFGPRLASRVVPL